MARIGLKIYYLRTQVTSISQADLAKALGVRQATISHIERGRSQPNTALLLEFCRFFDVIPAYLIDPDRGLPLRPTDRWSLRDANVTAGMWIEVAQEDVVEAGEDRLFIPLLPGQGFYDEEAYEEARQLATSEERARELARLLEKTEKLSRQMEEEIESELQEHPRRRKPMDGGSH